MTAFGKEIPQLFLEAFFSTGGGDRWTRSLELLPFCLHGGNRPEDEAGTAEVSQGKERKWVLYDITELLSQ